jgi:hypothetical protein
MTTSPPESDESRATTCSKKRSKLVGDDGLLPSYEARYSPDSKHKRPWNSILWRRYEYDWEMNLIALLTLEPGYRCTYQETGLLCSSLKSEIRMPDTSHSSIYGKEQLGIASWEGISEASSRMVRLYSESQSLSGMLMLMSV